MENAYRDNLDELYDERMAEYVGSFDTKKLNEVLEEIFSEGVLNKL